jgi:hypothetical protein
LRIFLSRPRILFLLLLVPGACLASGYDCKPEKSSQRLSVVVSNPSPQDLRDYPVAVALDAKNFDFSKASRDGGDVAVWDSTQEAPLSHWFESYDAATSRALLWVKVPSLASGGSAQLILTAGRRQECSARYNNGYSVFPFFSDVHDLWNWRRDPSLTLSRHVSLGPLVVEDRKVIQSDGFYNSTPGIAQAANGDWVLTYLKGLGHVGNAKVLLRRSQDHGVTWSPEQVYFDTATLDPTLVTTPQGDLLLSLAKRDPDGVVRGAYSRSQDNGLTWGQFQFVNDPASKGLGFGPLAITDQGTMFGLGYGASAVGNFTTPSFWASDDDGETWSKRGELTQPGETGITETGLARLGQQGWLALSRSDDDARTSIHRSEDFGYSWSTEVDYTGQVGAIHAPNLLRVGHAVLLIGREALGIPHVSPAVGFPNQLVAFVSYDGGHHFRYGTVLDTYTGLSIDGGYAAVLRTSPDRLFVVYYADSHGLRQPDIKSLWLRVIHPRNFRINALHLETQFTNAEATHLLNLNLQRYSLDFRFHSMPTPAGSQFAVSLRGPGSAGREDLVRWELPSTHATDPTAQSGIIAGNSFLPVLNTFSYGQSYRISTIVDETKGSQTAQVLGPLGDVLASLPPEVLAQGEAAHATEVAIGNGSTLRATDTLLDFVFIRPVSEVEPQVTVQRIR